MHRNSIGSLGLVIFGLLLATPAASPADDAQPPQSPQASPPPQLGPPQLGQPQLGQPQLGQPQLGQPQLGQPQLGPPLKSGPAANRSPSGAPRVPQGLPVPAPQQPAPPDLGPDNGSPAGPQSPATPGLSGIPGLEGMITPDGINLPGGLGFIRRTPDQIGIHLNTPDGPFQMTLPRRHRPVPGAGPLDEPPAPIVDGVPPFGGPPSIDQEESGGRTGRAAREFASVSRTFRSRHYPLALRRLAHSLQRHPADRDLLQLRSLAYFALGDYPAASHDASVLLARDDVWDWGTLRSLYNATGEYTEQYRALEDQALANANAIEPWLLLGYHNLMLGHPDAARRQFQRVAALDPHNEIARRLATAERRLQPQATSSGGVLVPVSGTSPTPPAGPPAQSRPLVRVPQRKGDVSIDLGQPVPVAPPKAGGKSSP